MKYLEMMNFALLIVIVLLFALITYSITVNDDVPKTIRIPLIRSDIRTRFLMFSNFLVLVGLLLVVYNTTPLFTWVSLTLIGVIVIYAMALIAGRVSKDKKTDKNKNINIENKE